MLAEGNAIGPVGFVAILGIYAPVWLPKILYKLFYARVPSSPPFASSNRGCARREISSTRSCHNGEGAPAGAVQLGWTIYVIISIRAFLDAMLRIGRSIYGVAEYNKHDIVVFRQPLIDRLRRLLHPSSQNATCGHGPRQQFQQRSAPTTTSKMAPTPIRMRWDRRG